MRMKTLNIIIVLLFQSGGHLNEFLKFGGSLFFATGNQNLLVIFLYLVIELFSCAVSNFYGFEKRCVDGI